MRVKNHIYQDSQNLKEFIDSNEFNNPDKPLLIQVFTGRPEVDFIKQLTAQITALVPYAELIGTTTAGEICDGKLLNNNLFIIKIGNFIIYWVKFVMANY